MDDLKQREGIDEFLAVINIFLTTQPSTVTWETVITAIESPIVNDKKTADLIHRYLTTCKSNKILLLINEVINSGLQTTPVKCIKFNLSQQ